MMIWQDSGHARAQKLYTFKTASALFSAIDLVGNKYLDFSESLRSCSLVVMALRTLVR